MQRKTVRTSRTDRSLLLLLLLVSLVAAGCGEKQNSLHPASKQEHAISTLWWVMMTGAWIGFGVIAVLLLLGWLRRNRPDLPFGLGERAAVAIVVVLGVAVPIAVLSTLFVWSDVYVIKKTQPPRAASTALTVQVIGHQWFWELRYPGTKAVTANELHIPVRTRVNVVGTTADVIHSFWVPELNRKIDLIPGRSNRVLLEADRPGIFRGQCAEFCGLQHAHMALRVFAEPKSRFRAWLQNAARPARRPKASLERRGEQLFLSAACSGCHEIRGTAADGQVGPDLTHLATRTSLAAVTIPNERAALAEWIRDPQHVKPGNKMPGLALNDAEVKALVAYLVSLK
jgi:cytochrome c oxidase subunit II